MSWPPSAKVRARLIVTELASEMLLRSQRKLHHAFQELVRRQADEVVHDELLGVEAPMFLPARPVSTGEFNRSVQHQLQSIGRGFEGQGLSRALIEPQSNAIEVGLGEAREIGSSRDVLSQQAVGVLVAATLPWTARITEVNLHVGGNREAFVARHLLALVPRQGAS